MNRQIHEICMSFKSLYAMSFQVLPFIYTHLVSLAASTFLLANAFIKGMYYTPDASYAFGVVLPATNIMLMAVTIFGLLEVGDTVVDPFGNDPEDFAVIHFIEYTAVSSQHLIHMPTARSEQPDKQPVGAKGARSGASQARAQGMSSSTSESSSLPAVPPTPASLEALDRATGCSTDQRAASSSKALRAPQLARRLNDRSPREPLDPTSYSRDRPASRGASLRNGNNCRPVNRDRPACEPRGTSTTADGRRRRRASPSISHRRSRRRKI